MKLRLCCFALLVAVLAGCAQPASTATPSAAPAESPTSPPPTSTQSPPTATPMPTNTVEPTATPVPPTATLQPMDTVVPPTPTLTATPGPAIPAGMGGLLVTNNIGQYDINFGIDAKNYAIPMGGGKLSVYLSPGTHNFSVARNQNWSFSCSKANNCTVEIAVGQITQLSIDRSNYGD